MNRMKSSTLVAVAALFATASGVVLKTTQIEGMPAVLLWAAVFFGGSVVIAIASCMGRTFQRHFIGIAFYSVLVFVLYELAFGWAIVGFHPGGEPVTLTARQKELEHIGYVVTQPILKPSLLLMRILPRSLALVAMIVPIIAYGTLLHLLVMQILKKVRRSQINGENPLLIRRK